ncbi:MAG: N-acetylmuramoyl-L-alanine amidase [Alphaproteobacteria bacterium]|nr:N-acetylmuramoyl-L-alanine amidase [Alphaproteobacteria bacterium]
MRRKLLPYYGERKSKIDMIVLHAVAFDIKEAIDSFSENEVSSHYIVAENGEIWQLVGEKRRARHAGVSYWRGIEDINSHSIGIEFCSKTLGQKNFSRAQIASGVELIKKLVKKYKIKPENIVGHSDVAPTRKPDPGKAFFWKELAKEGIGFWYDIADAKKMDNCSVGELLQIIGYDISDVHASVYAFCRRFLPQKVIEIKDVCELVNNVGKADELLLQDKKFLQVLKAVAYKYVKESKTPCKI